MDFVVSFILTAVFLKLLINRAKKGQMTQTIREDGPQAHFAKSGTPTMGGVSFTLASIFFIVARYFVPAFFVHIFMYLSFIFLIFLIMGFVDDVLNIKKSRYLGIRPLDKFHFQVAFAVLFVYFFRIDVSFLEKLFYTLFLVFVFVGTVNAVNITDGLDGLAAGCVSLCFVPFLIYSIVQQQWGVVFFILMILGCTTAFLWFNVHPAKIFMGNCGSMGLGSALAAVAIVLHKEFMLLICGAVFVLETLSVMIQVGYFKTTKKRIFKMAPIHHHFELSGYKETQVTHGLWLAGLASCILGAWVFKVLEFGF